MVVLVEQSPESFYGAVFLLLFFFILSGSPRRQHANAFLKSSGSQTQAAAQEEDEDGLPSLDTEVWSWGRGSEGQLGHGDQLARYDCKTAKLYLSTSSERGTIIKVPRILRLKCVCPGFSLCVSSLCQGRRWSKLPQVPIIPWLSPPPAR